MDTEPMTLERTIKENGIARMLAFYYVSQNHHRVRQENLDCVCHKIILSHQG